MSSSESSWPTSDESVDSEPEEPTVPTTLPGWIVVPFWSHPDNEDLCKPEAMKIKEYKLPDGSFATSFSK